MERHMVRVVRTAMQVELSLDHVALLYRPAGHPMQNSSAVALDAAAVFVYDPVPQLWHSLSWLTPTEVENLPSVHSMHPLIEV